MSMTNKQELQKAIDIAKEFIQRADDLIGDIEDQERNKDKDWFGRTHVSSRETSSARRQSMELTRQLAILRRA